MSIHYSAPGKLFIAGEWSILEKGNVGLVTAVNRRVHAVVDRFNTLTGTSVCIRIRDFGINIIGEFNGKTLNFEALTDDEKSKISFIKESIETTFRYIKEMDVHPKSFMIETWGEDTNLVVDGKQQKVGFGSSAAAVVATVAAVLKYHDIEPKKDLVYKLSMIVHYFAQGKVGSGFDVATSTYGGYFSYIAPDTEWITSEICKGNINNVVAQEWPLLYIEHLEPPVNCKFIIAWTKSSSDTREMIKSVKEWAKLNPDVYQQSIRRIGSAAFAVVEAWKTGDQKLILNCIKESRIALSDFTKESGQLIETQDLAMLADIAESFGAAGKLSGAGGGDCGFAICFDDSTASKIRNKWGEYGLYPLDVIVDMEGIKEEK